MKDNKTIIEVYKKRVYNELLIEKRAKLARLEEADPIGAFVEKVNKDYVELLKNSGMQVDEDFILIPSYEVTDETARLMDEAEKEFKDKMDDRDRIVEEVTALLDLAYDEGSVLELYQKFGILDAEGKIYDYKK